MHDLFNIPIERSLLSAILFDPNIFDTIEDELGPSDFGYHNHSIIFATMGNLKRLDLPINEEFIRKKLSSKANIDEDIFEIISTAPIIDIKSYVKEIQDLSLKRKLHHLANTIKEKSIDINLPSREIINELESEIFNLQSKSSNREFRTFGDVTSSVISMIKELKERGNSYLIGVDTGFPELNRYTTGFNKGELIILAARPAMGKTSLALNMLIPTLKSGKGVAFFSLEMGAEQIVLRMMSSIANIPLQRLRIGDLDDKEWNYFQSTCDKLESWKFYIDDSGGLDITHLRSKLRKLKSKDPSISLAIVDYLQIMSGIGNKDRHLEIAEISRGLKILARELDIPILALSQLNRTLESRGDRRPILSDLRESGSIEQDADIILFIYRDAVYKRRDMKEKIEQAKKEGKPPPKEEILVEQDNEEAELIIGKHRNGPIGTIKLKMDTKYTRFVSIESHITEQSETKILNDLDDMIPL
ncbi:replicative DNA helicase [Helicobacter sp. 16-1353]|uniref:replicative DNA helicase n=1 Tax=Helicobacter sp. 16-1353 TaxID=2004996 RepID=UPI000DCCB537|nr:replicative DNA helicase [Helicobacter sp. 16-1353]RAX53834.1 replicative DNA helicase [Helicobacter sp. 16-1353]